MKLIWNFFLCGFKDFYGIYRLRKERVNPFKMIVEGKK